MVLPENMVMIPPKKHLAGTINHWILGIRPQVAMFLTNPCVSSNFWAHKTVLQRPETFLDVC